MDHDVGAREGEKRREAPPEDAPTQAWRPTDEGGKRAWPLDASREERQWPRAGASGAPPDAAPEPRSDARPLGGGTTAARADRTTAPDEASAKRPAMQVRRLRRGRLAIRKVDPWAVLKFSLVFYFCMLLIFLLGTAVIFATLKAFGVIEDFERMLRNLQINYTIAGGTIFRWLFLVGLVGTVVASAITVFLSFLYNLIADVVGGIELLVTERE